MENVSPNPSPTLVTVDLPVNQNISSTAVTTSTQDERTVPPIFLNFVCEEWRVMRPPSSFLEPWPLPFSRWPRLRAPLSRRRRETDFVMPSLRRSDNRMRPYNIPQYHQCEHHTHPYPPQSSQRESDDAFYQQNGHNSQRNYYQPEFSGYERFTERN